MKIGLLMSNKIKILIFITLISLVFVSGCLDKIKESQIQSEIEKASYCNSDNDCVIVEGQCPFGCYLGINKLEADRISSLVKSFQSNCIYSCIPTESVSCVSNKCEVNLQKPPIKSEINKEICESTGGTWNECGSPCAGTDAEVCILVCKAQCECNSNEECPDNYKCRTGKIKPGVCI